MVNKNKIKINHSTLKMLPPPKPIFSIPLIKKKTIDTTTSKPIIIPKTNLNNPTTLLNTPITESTKKIIPVENTIKKPIPVIKTDDKTTINTNTTTTKPIETIVNKPLIVIPTTMNASHTIKEKEKEKKIVAVSPKKNMFYIGAIVGAIILIISKK